MPVTPSPATARIVTPSGIVIDAYRMGWVGVKGTHRELDVPAFFAIPSIFLGRQWTPWLPIIGFVIRHPEGTFLVDTGPAAGFADPAYWACDKRTGFFYRKNLRFDLPADELLAPRLAALGIADDSVRAIVVTHFHADHTGGLEGRTDRRVITGAGNWPRHVGSFTCRFPASFAPETIPDAPFDTTLAGGLALTRDGTVRVVPVPGHTPGHVGVVIEDGTTRILLAGDATFDLDQSARGGITGVATDKRAARATQRTLTALDRLHVLVLPAHDTTVFARMRAWQSAHPAPPPTP
ncbi:MAG: MBL fold metallo-hydrolase [Gemmatimonadaceae bacterium]|nr:MBL fold metallo-hydrolase [Gemmatimonadaceae bacterium]